MDSLASTNVAFTTRETTPIAVHTANSDTRPATPGPPSWLARRNVPSNFHPEITKRIEEKKSDDFILTVRRKKRVYSYRVVIKFFDSGSPLALVTSLMDRSVYSVADVEEAFGLRWWCEESYKFQKLTLQLENFSSKTAHGVWQDFWATVVLSTLIALLFNQEEEEMGDLEIRINRSVVFGSLKQRLLKTLMGEMSYERFYSKFKRLCKQHKMRKRPGRSYRRPSFDTRKTRHIYRICI